MQDLIDEPQPFKPNAGFFLFLSALFLPMIAAVAIYLGAWAVSGQVHAAEAAQNSQIANTQSNSLTDTHVAGWKKSLVGICPLH
jgi:hypothetical protein